MVRVHAIKWLVLVSVALAPAGGGYRALQAQETSAGIEFQSSATPGLDTIYLRSDGAHSAGGLLSIEVWANEVSDLYGLSFTLQFPQSLLRFPKTRETVFVEGPFLSDGGAEDTKLLVRQVGKEITVGHSRLGENGGVSGSGLLMTLEFRGRGLAGKKLFRLRRETAFDSAGEKLENYSWLAGKVIVTVAD